MTRAIALLRNRIRRAPLSRRFLMRDGENIFLFSMLEVGLGPLLWAFETQT
jgi:hypothetical protein